MRIFGMVGAAMMAAAASIGAVFKPREVHEEKHFPPPQAYGGNGKKIYRGAGKANPAGTKLARKAAEGKLGLRR